MSIMVEMSRAIRHVVEDHAGTGKTLEDIPSDALRDLATIACAWGSDLAAELARRGEISEAFEPPAGMPRSVAETQLRVLTAAAEARMELAHEKPPRPQERGEWNLAISEFVGAVMESRALIAVALPPETKAAA